MSVTACLHRWAVFRFLTDTAVGPAQSAPMHRCLQERRHERLRQSGPQAPAGRYDGIERPYSAAEVERLRGSLPISYTLAERGANKPVAAAERRALHQRAGRRHRQPGHADGPRGAQGHLSVGLAGRGRRQHGRRHVSRPVALPGQRRAGAVPPHQPHPAARRPDRASEGGAKRDWFAPIVGGRRSRLRRPAQQLRDHEGLHRGRRRGRPLRGPARLRRRSAATWAARC